MQTSAYIFPSIVVLQERFALNGWANPDANYQESLVVILEDRTSLHIFTSHDPVHGWYQLGNWFVIVMGDVPGPGMQGCITKALTSARGQLVELAEGQIQGLLGAWSNAIGKVDEPDMPDSMNGRTATLVRTERPPLDMDTLIKKLLRGEKL